uniref:Uncharacterized protein n=1 Tax=Plectus sambesii TaxID=2011161 RepID=A0A914UVX4_9BILA
MAHASSSAIAARPYGSDGGLLKQQQQQRQYSADEGYPRHCDLCPPSLVFRDRFNFADHLRAVHCTKEGGSYVCRYGLNGVCQTLPLEGVSDSDYELHIRKHHIMSKSHSPQQLGSNEPSPLVAPAVVKDATNSFTVFRYVRL